MGNVVDISNHMPHMVITLIDGSVRVVPWSMFKDLVSGRLKMSDVEEGEPLFRTIIDQWMKQVEEENE